MSSLLSFKHLKRFSVSVGTENRFKRKEDEAREDGQRLPHRPRWLFDAMRWMFWLGRALVSASFTAFVLCHVSSIQCVDYYFCWAQLSAVNFLFLLGSVLTPPSRGTNPM